MRTKLTPQSALTIAAILAVLAMIILTGAPDSISFPAQDGWIIHADLYGASDRGVVLWSMGTGRRRVIGRTGAGGREGRLSRARDRPRGFGLCHDGPLSANREATSFDVLAAVRYLRKTGAKTVALVGSQGLKKRKSSDRDDG